MADYNNGSVTVTVTGGQAPYTYTLQELIGSNYVTVPDNEYTSPAWDNPVTVSSTTYTFGNSAGPDQNTTINETGIRPGTYRVRIVDASGSCEIFTDAIVVDEFTVGGGSAACVTFETAPAGTPLPNSWVLDVSQPTSQGAFGTISVGVPGSQVNGGFSNEFNAGEITGKVVHTNGNEYNFVTYSGVSGPLTTVSYDTGPVLPAGSYTGFLEVPSEGCSRNLGNITVIAYQVPTLDITGITISSGGSTVSPSNLVVGTPYTVTINTNSANLIGVAEYLFSVNGTTNYTQSPTGFTTSNQFTVTINAAGTFSMFAAVQDSANVSTTDTETVSVTVSAGGVTPAFTCTDAAFNMVGSTTDQVGSPSINFASVSLGTLQSVSPSTIQAGNTTYTATIQIPAGYQNPGGTLTTCTDTSVGNTSGGGGGTGTTVYYFHGGATNVGWPHTVGGAMTDANAIYYTPSSTTGSATLSDAMTFVLDNYGNGATAVPDFLGGGSGYFIRSVEFPAGTTLLDNGDAASSTEITFDAIDNGDYCYIAVPQVTGFTDDLAANPGNILYSGIPLSGANAIQKKAFTWNGQQYMLFSINALGIPFTQESITIDN